MHIQEVFFPTPVPIWHILSVTFSGVIPWVHSWQLEDTELKNKEEKQLKWKNISENFHQIAAYVEKEGKCVITFHKRS